MPAILTRLVKQLKAKGYTDSSAHAIAVSSLQKSGNLKKGTAKATSKGKKRGKMTPSARARDRASKTSGKHSTKEYKYNSKTNLATLKKKKKK